MPNPYYQTFTPPEELVTAALEAVRLAKTSGKVKKGVNEVIKAIERGQAKFVLIATDVDPPEIVAFLPTLCEERKISYIFVNSKAQLGEVAGLSVPASSVAVVDPGEAKGYIEEIVKKIQELKK
ncbi:MAG: 50S ribosomal protein L7Ae [Candidatus Caldarchaeum sp.]|jgi:large subunit ribosomal protein L7Ae|uniref:Large ribosomal subunit protein eL8 n=1 Tax=Caldiarchaeum subterraneum TaxID=311458 RepID=E6N581_CALS0|nr:50S ribosomal protein L7Ae [Candidatus Caldarchaeales archaeon]BAJ47450.1 large subunit ribosomal protein L7Ae [Candidatus Caldarchaeum subterraneum]BAJ49274.1 large subunit ribosomal protein L7Ae [Candidatus Caldarchaeum subterraneum]BAJ50289.1 large subunit ribosomal protein L7Ae [Candidatus Caldarchaeum subterraneum]GBC72315.1 Ribosome-associated protein L7Ae-like protein [archaeon HR03]